MTQPDSLEATLLAVPPRRIATCISGCHTDDGGPDGPALAAAARKWIREQMPKILFETVVRAGWESGIVKAYNEALADVRRALGLEP